MALSRLFIIFVKYGLLILVITGASLLIINTAIVRKYKIETIEDLPYKTRSSVRTDSSVLDKNSLRCLTSPSRPFCLLSWNRRLQLLKSRLLPAPTQKTNVINSSNSFIHPVYKAIEDFKNLMHSLNVRPVLLEPSVLFCMLSPFHKYNLISSGLNPHVLRGYPDLITFGIKTQDSKILNQEFSLNKTMQLGYKFSRSRKWMLDRYFEEETSGDIRDTQYFYYRLNITIQVVVFFDRGNFLWSPKVPAKEFGIRDGLFMRNFAFENFTFVPLRFENGKETGFYLPSNIVSFLLQIQNSEFRECPHSGKGIVPPLTSDLTMDQLQQRVLIVLQELKAKNFGFLWLWNDTLHGWNKNCNIFKETSQFNIAVDGAVVSKMNISETFAGNKYLQLLTFHPLKNITHKFTMDCYGLQVNIFPFYGDINSVWYFEENSSGELIRYTYSKFRLCATEMMEQLVYIPCEEVKLQLNG